MWLLGCCYAFAKVVKVFCESFSHVVVQSLPAGYCYVVAIRLLRYSECILLVLVVVWLSGCCYNAVKVFGVSFTHYCFMWLG